MAVERVKRLKAEVELRQGSTNSAETDLVERSRQLMEATQALQRGQNEVGQIAEKCRTTSKQLEDEIQSYKTNTQNLINIWQQQINDTNRALLASQTAAQTGKAFAEHQAELGFGRNLGAEFEVLGSLMRTPGETGARLTAIVIALFFGLIDLTPVIWGWSLRDGGVDAFTGERVRTYLRELESAEASAAWQIAAKGKIQAETIDAQSAEDRRLVRQRAQYEADLSAAKQYADAIGKLDRMLNSSTYSNVGEESLGRVKREALESLSISYRRWSERTPP